MPPKKESTAHKITRVRPPRVHITYDVDIGGAIEMKELPFVVGVLGDYSGQPDPNQPLPKLTDRKFIEIDRDNFDSVLAGMKPRLALSVANKLTGLGDKRMSVKLQFNKLEDFEPDNVVQQVEPLQKLVEGRRKLSDLLSKMDGNDRLEELLQDVIQNTGAQKQLSEALGLEGTKPKGEISETKEKPNE